MNADSMTGSSWDCCSLPLKVSWRRIEVGHLVENRKAGAPGQSSPHADQQEPDDGEDGHGRDAQRLCPVLKALDELRNPPVNRCLFDRLGRDPRVQLFAPKERSETGRHNGE
jgi:hypothetical protein